MTENSVLLQSNYSGLTGLVEFDTKGMRSNIAIDVMYLDQKGLNKIGNFKPNTIERLSFLTLTEEIDESEDRPINEMTFNVIISVVSLMISYLEFSFPKIW